MNRYDEFLHKRGILAGRLTEGRLVHYRKGDVEACYQADPKLRDHAAAAKWRADISDGILIVKHPVPGEDPIIAQFRPFGHRRKGKYEHTHAELTDRTRQAHIRRKVKEGGHGGADPNDELHDHIEYYGKYLLMPSPREQWSHVHDLDRWTKRIIDKAKSRGGRARSRTQAAALASRQLERHLETHGSHTGDALHAHEGRKRDTTISPEKRLDMSTHSTELLRSGGVSRVWFVLEGSIKSTALEAAGECALAVPSVTMWRAPELERFAQAWLRDKLVYVVCDSDWASNPMVSLQAFECRNAIRRYLDDHGGIWVHVAAPTPEPEDCTLHDEDKGSKRGVDDFMADGGRPDHLDVLDRRMSSEFDQWADEQRLAARSHKGRAREAAENRIKVMEWFATHATREGDVKKPASVIASYAEVTDNTVHNSVLRLLSDGYPHQSALTAMKMYELKRQDGVRVRVERRIVGDPAHVTLGVSEFIRDINAQVIWVADRNTEHRRRPVERPKDWDGRPTFTIREDLRAVDDVRHVGDMMPLR